MTHENARIDEGLVLICWISIFSTTISIVISSVLPRYGPEFISCNVFYRLLWKGTEEKPVRYSEFV